jgi:Collagen triple helix repeat (20 copies)
MFSKLFRPSQVVAYVALFVALGGTSFAAVMVTGRQVKDGSLTGTDLKNGSVTGKDLKNRSVTTYDIRDGSLMAKDFKFGQLPAAAAGAQGLRGFKGDTGSTGAAGATGDTGATGATGDAGDAGSAGSAGDAGPQGEPGAEGAPGIQGPQGDPGAAGTNGAPGADGSALGFAHVNADATLDEANSENVVPANVASSPVAGVYCFSGLTFAPRNVIAMITASGSAISAKGSLEAIDPSGFCPAGTTVWIETVTGLGVLTPNGFYVSFN